MDLAWAIFVSLLIKFFFPFVPVLRFIVLLSVASIFLSAGDKALFLPLFVGTLLLSAVLISRPERNAPAKRPRIQWKAILVYAVLSVWFLKALHTTGVHEILSHIFGEQQIYVFFLVQLAMMRVARQVSNKLAGRRGVLVFLALVSVPAAVDVLVKVERFVLLAVLLPLLVWGVTGQRKVKESTLRNIATVAALALSVALAVT